jgi:hypothetical protein
MKSKPEIRLKSATLPPGLVVAFPYRDRGSKPGFGVKRMIHF